MAPSHPRSPSPSDESRATKRVKLVDNTSRDVVADFYAGLLEPANATRLHEDYAASKPYLHGVIDKLFDDALLHSAADEIIRELHFTEKETDIYKVPTATRDSKCRCSRLDRSRSTKREISHLCPT
jgi:hypothetical protein